MQFDTILHTLTVEAFMPTTHSLSKAKHEIATEIFIMMQSKSKSRNYESSVRGEESIWCDTLYVGQVTSGALVINYSSGSPLKRVLFSWDTAFSIIMAIYSIYYIRLRLLYENIQGIFLIDMRLHQSSAYAILLQAIMHKHRVRAKTPSNRMKVRFPQPATLIGVIFLNQC